jgi:hypothetical protein
MPGQILTQLPQHYETSFSDNWEFLVQQKDSRFENYVKRSPVNGKERRFSQLGAINMRPVVTRNGETIPQDSPMAARWLRVRGYDAVTWIDEWDEISLGELPAPQGESVMQHGMAARRQIDDVIIAAATGTAYIGVDGTTAVDLGAAQTVAVNYNGTASPANAGMTLAKLIRAKFLLDTQEVPMDNRYLAMSAQQLTDLLLNTDQVNNSRYNDVKALVDGQVTRFLGFNFIFSERLSLDTATDIRTCFAWYRDGIVLGEPQATKARIDILPTQNHSIQIRTTLVVGATRLQEPYVVMILCDQSP